VVIDDPSEVDRWTFRTTAKLELDGHKHQVEIKVETKNASAT